MIRLTFQTCGWVSCKPSDQIELNVPISIGATDVFTLPLAKTRNSAVPRRDCSPTLVSRLLIRMNSKRVLPRLAWIRARVASGSSDVSAL